MLLKIIYLIILVNLINLCNCNGHILTGKNCLVTEPNYGNTFDFNDLKSSMAKTLIDETTKNKLTFNVCGKSSKKCKGQDVFACLDLHNPKNPDTESQKILAYDQILYWNNGRLSFESIGEPCQNGKNYSLIILMECDYRMAERQYNLYPTAHEDQCELVIHFKTNKACLEKPANVKNANCFGNGFDLVPLGSENIPVKAGKMSNDYFYIGLCDPTLYGYNLLCPKGSNICLVKSDSHLNATERYINVGSMTSNPIMDTKGVVMLNLTSNTECKNGKKHESHISFICDPSSQSEDPEYVGSVDDCAHYFSWYTKHVCSGHKPCQAKNLKTKDVLDMSSLSGHRFNVTSNDTSKIYYFSVCSAAGEPCLGESTGSCHFDVRKNQLTQLGIVNSDLEIVDSGALFLNYTSGSICHYHQKHSTRIQFICINGDQKEGPMLIEDKDCEILIHFNTKLACPKNDVCKTRSPDGNSDIDLEALINNKENYIATVNATNLPNEKGSFLLNVCRPLVSKYSLNCQGAACRTTIEANGKHENELNLGFPDSASSMIAYKEDGKTIVEMKYFEGDPCPTDKDTDSSTSIKFFCDPKAGYGTPILQSITDCHYDFDFPTNILCDDEVIDFKKDSCILNDNKTNFNSDLRKVADNGMFTIVDDSNHNLTVNICDDKGFYQIVYKQHRVKGEFVVNTRQKNCNGNYDIEVQLVCSSRSHQEIEKDSIFCRATLIQETPLICELFNITPRNTFNEADEDKNEETTVKAETVNKDEVPTKGASSGIIILIVILIILIFVLVGFVLRNPVYRNTISNIFIRSSERNVRYSRVDNEEADLLLDARHPDDSDDDILL